MQLKKLLSQEPTIFLSRTLWRFSVGMRRRVVFYITLFVIANLILLLPPLIFGAFIREIQSDGVTHHNFNYLLLLLGLLFVNQVAFWAFQWPARIMERSVAFGAEINYRTHLLKNVLSLNLSWHVDHDSGDTIDKVNKAGDSLASFGQNVFQIIQLIVNLIGTVVILCFFSPLVGIFSIVCVLLSFIAVLWFDQHLTHLYQRVNIYINKSQASVFDALSNVTSVKILHIEKPILDGIATRMNAPRSLYQKMITLHEAKWFTGAMLFQAIAVVPIGIYLYHTLTVGNKVDVGSISTLYLYLSNLIYVYYGFTGLYQDFATYKNRLANAKPIEDAYDALRFIHRKPIKKWEALTIRDVSFTYDGDQDTLNLTGVSLGFRRGDHIALVGESGSGKTTFLKVLHGLYPSAHGTILIDGMKSVATSFADVDLKTMLVPQEPELFASTIRENITLGVEYHERDITEVCSVARFDTVIAELPRGLESIINEKGVNLSGGQKQRLALARALLFAKDKNIILLDESTSSVDSVNEVEIYTNIWEAFKGKTVVASIHKMNLLKFFDRIYIFEKGSIADSGTFDELLSQNASFRDSWNAFVETAGND